MTEWRDIKGFEGKYQVSESGEVKRMSYPYVNKGKMCFHKEIIKKPILRKDGYLGMRLINTSFLVHRLVAGAFLPNPNNLPEVNHKEGNKTDNRACMLEWCNRSHNQKHAYKIGIKKPAPNIGKWNKGKQNSLGRGTKIQFQDRVFKDINEAALATGIAVPTIYSHCGGYVRNQKFKYVA